MHLAASKPFNPGIDTSTKTTSGLRSAAFCTASIPSTARPQTTHPERASRAEHKQFLIVSLSSATKIRRELGIGFAQFLVLPEVNRSANLKQRVYSFRAVSALCFRAAERNSTYSHTR